GSDIREALGGTRGFRGVSGIMDMDADGNAVKDALILCVKDGEFRYVETLAFGEQKEAEVQDKKN
ncbi:MAG TPA: hypothetical protein PLA74_13030, partial [Syntrophales bacterium]|nr:hypothetical protein [Syntrophales bacterium]